MALTGKKLAGGLVAAVLLTAAFGNAAFEARHHVERQKAHEAIAAAADSLKVAPYNLHFIDKDLVYEKGDCSTVPLDLSSTCQAIKTATAGKYDLRY